MSWTDERVAILQKLWKDGLSASLIATKIGEVTRNAVIGKAHRLGLAGRATTSRVRLSRPPRRTIAGNARAVHSGSLRGSSPPARKHSPLRDAPPKRRNVPEASPPLEDAPDIRLGIGELTPAACCWPIGDPRQPDFEFCGRNRAERKPYCPHHQALAISR
ncbi:MAG: GcrA family cell cycle regulator [Rhodomicrobium sp.]